MKTVTRSIVIDRSPDEVFDLIDAPERYPEFFVGLTKWDSLTEQRTGVGARYRVLMRVGSIEAGGTVRVTEWSEGEFIAWEWETGIHQEGRWTLQPSGSTTGWSGHLPMPTSSWSAKALAPGPEARPIPAVLVASVPLGCAGLSDAGLSHSVVLPGFAPPRSSARSVRPDA